MPFYACAIGKCLGSIPNPGEKSGELIQPWCCTEWTAVVDFKDFYSLGNVYNNVCSDASDDVEWSIGPLRNFKLFSLQRSWLHQHVKLWEDNMPLFEDEGLSLHRNPTARRLLSEEGESPSYKSSPRVASDAKDLRWWLQKAARAKDHTLRGGGSAQQRRWTVKGLYQLSASLRKARSGTMFVRLLNDWNVDHEPGFPYSNGVVNRRHPDFLAWKSVRTTELVRAMMSSVPTLPGEEPRPFWSHEDELELDSNALFVMRGATAMDDPGLNVLFTGKQLKDAMKNMTRNMKVNPSSCRRVTRFFLWPLGALINHVRGKKAKKSKSGQFGPLETIVWFMRKTTGESPSYVIYAVVALWALLVITLVGRGLLNLSMLHDLEPSVALSYYVWASAFLALEVANEVTRIPSEIPFSLAYKQANLSMIEAELTRIEDGQQLRVTGMGFLQMVCRLHEGEEEEDEDEEEEDEGDDDEADPFNIGRGTLDLIWEQSQLRDSLPFVDNETTAADVIYDFEVKGKVISAMDWEERNGIYMQGLETGIDTGKPTPKARAFIICLALLNASIGMLHRYLMGIDVIGEVIGEGVVVLSCFVVTFACSYIVYNTLFCVAFQWYTVLIFMEQLASVLIIDGAMRVHLPCYIDLRHEGNLEGWYSARDYLNHYCNTYIFGMKNQAIVASSLIISAIVSFRAVTNHFSDSANIDWSNPGGWFSLLNMLVLAALLFLALVALERINAETTKLVKKLDLVGIEVSRTSTISQTARERLDQDKMALELTGEERDAGLRKRMAAQAVTSDLSDAERSIRLIASELEELKDEQKKQARLLSRVEVHSNDIINRQEIASEYQYLSNIIAELRDQSESRKIFGLVVDRQMLARIFGGVATVIYLILKETADAIIKKYAPPTFPLAAVAAMDDDGGSL